MTEQLAAKVAASSELTLLYHSRHLHLLITMAVGAARTVTTKPSPKSWR